MVHRYPPVGKCIYCEKTAVEAGPKGLTVEHIIPYSLGGTLELSEASCSVCADETHAFEGLCAGHLFEAARAHFHWKSRKRKRPKVLTFGGPGRSVPIDEHPPAIIFPLFQMPGILLNEPITNDGKMVCVGMGVYRGPEFRERFKRLGSDGLSVRFKTDPLAKMVAKIGHSYAVAELGLDGFVPLTQEMIIGKNNHYSHYVGNGFAEGNKTEDLHTIRLEWMADLLVAHVGLYSRYGTPPFVAVVGKRKP
jgi:hypothetical protein